MKILITGGAGYIGSHTLVEVLNASQEAKKDKLGKTRPKLGEGDICVKVSLGRGFEDG